jgi:hypothetical protein
MHGEMFNEGHGSGCNLPLTLSTDHDEEKLLGMRDDLPTLLARDQGNGGRWDYLEYPVKIIIQSNNNSMRPRLIYNMVFP